MAKLAHVASALVARQPETADLLAAIAAFGNIHATLDGTNKAVRGQIDALSKRHGELLAKLATALFTEFNKLSARIAALESREMPAYASPDSVAQLRTDVAKLAGLVGTLPTELPAQIVPRETNLEPVLTAIAAIDVTVPHIKRSYTMTVEYDQWGDVTGARIVEI